MATLRPSYDGAKLFVDAFDVVTPLVHDLAGRSFDLRAERFESAGRRERVPEHWLDRLAFSLGGGQLAHLITSDHFRRLAAAIGIGPDHALSVVTSMTKRMADTWVDVCASRQVPPFVMDVIDRRLNELPLMRNL
jgi:hypothetical protein